MFISSEELDGDLGGINGGNNQCQLLAAGAGLSGTWKAWLSTDVVNARDNISYNATIRYVLAANGTVIAEPGALLNADFVDLSSTINRDEFGALTSAFYAWTGTIADGTRAAQRCTNWTTNLAGFGNLGEPSRVDGNWTVSNNDSCTLSFPIYCFEQPV